MTVNISDTLDEAIKIRDISRIHSVFSVIAHEDPTFNTGKFKETLDYVKKQEIPFLIQPNAGPKFKEEDEWNEEYWFEVAADLQDNFSEERINHLDEVGKSVYGKARQKGKKTKNIDLKEYKRNNNQTFLNLKKDTKKLKLLTCILGVITVTAFILKKRNRG